LTGERSATGRARTRSGKTVCTIHLIPGTVNLEGICTHPETEHTQKQNTPRNRKVRAHLDMESKDMAERVRFAPSPTGYFHVGSARTILFNWLVARKTGGSLLLRIDDTDTERNREEWVTGILEAIDWLGIDYDEGPIRQSSRLDRYRDVARRLFECGMAYYCGCRAEDVAARKAPGAPPGYDGHCRNTGLGPGPGRALRFKVPHKEVTVNDLVRGQVRFPAGSIEDFVILKSNGDPLYVLANVVDDIDFEITLVMRAEEHLPTTPKAVLLHEALDAAIPRFAHLPVLVRQDRKKLSKRRDKVAVEDYKNQGYLPHAMLNYLALLGWSPKSDQEFFTLEELIENFDVEGINHSPAFFDEKKLAHFNKHYLGELGDDSFKQYAIPFIESAGIRIESNPAALDQLLPEVKPRVSTLSEVPQMVAFAFGYISPSPDEVDRLPDNSATLLESARKACRDVEPFEAEQLERHFRELS
jgi:glutamyl-tRNA synthetase